MCGHAAAIPTTLYAVSLNIVADKDKSIMLYLSCLFPQLWCWSSLLGVVFDQSTCGMATHETILPRTRVIDMMIGNEVHARLHLTVVVGMVKRDDVNGAHFLWRKEK